MGTPILTAVTTLPLRLVSLIGVALAALAVLAIAVYLMLWRVPFRFFVGIRNAFCRAVGKSPVRQAR
jgi:hypothetical protein